MRTHGSFGQAISSISTAMKLLSYAVHSGKWQGLDISKKPEMQMYELLNWSFQVPLSPYERIEQLQRDIEPNLPWADQHFLDERVSGQPINPGETWKIWPWGNSADKFRTEGEQFNHSYAERYWPKHAGLTPNGKMTPDDYDRLEALPRRGIRYEYADLDDLINHLVADPLSRQAYMPVWFPEDGSHNDRKPCSIGYHFILRNGYFHIVYQLRSCDFYRHFRDDVYLTARLHNWVLTEIQHRAAKDGPWGYALPGMFVMHITSLHVFKNDYRALYGQAHPSEADQKA